MFTYKLRVREFHLDTFGHMNNATYLQIFEEARWELITANQYDLNKIRETGLGPVILEANIQFLKEIRLREEISIQTHLQDYEGKVGHIMQEMLNEKGELAAKALFAFGLFDLRARKLVFPTPEWKKALGLK